VDLLERYLEAVRRCLPSAQADDIVAELGGDLRQQIEDREGALGRALSEDELSAMLKDRGHPMKVASAYLPKQYLIGPELYPTWRFVLRLVLGWILPPVFLFIVGPTLYLTSDHHAGVIVTTAAYLMEAEVSALGWITLVFAILERTHPRLAVSAKWDPRMLPRLSASGLQKVPRATAIGDMITGILSSTFWVYAMQHGSASFSLGAAELTPAPIWQTLAWPILVTTLASIPLGWIALVRPYAVMMRSTFRIALDLASGVIATILLRADGWVSIAVPSSPAAGAEATKWVNLCIGISLLIAIVSVAIDAMWHAWRLLRRTGGKSSRLAGALR
jgi:hypothetical protein